MYCLYTLRTVYSALIVPHFNYNILVWGFNSRRVPEHILSPIDEMTCNKNGVRSMS